MKCCSTSWRSKATGFAHGVTENLQFAVREAIELLANEWIEDRRAKGWGYLRLRAEEADIGAAHGFPQNEDGSYEVTADQLKGEALAFVYRLPVLLLRRGSRWRAGNPTHRRRDLSTWLQSRVDS